MVGDSEIVLCKCLTHRVHSVAFREAGNLVIYPDYGLSKTHLGNYWPLLAIDIMAFGNKYKFCTEKINSVCIATVPRGKNGRH